MVKWPLLVGTRIVGDGPMVATFLTTLPRPAGILSPIGPPTSLGRVTNDKAIFPAITVSFGHKCGTLFVAVRKPLLFGRFGIRWWRWTNGEPELHRLASPNNVSFASLTLASQWNISFGIAFKHVGLGDGLPTLCMSFVGWEPAILIASIGSNHSLVKGSLLSSVRWSKFDISFVGPLFGPFGLSGMTRCSTKNNGMNPRWSLAFGIPLSCMSTRLGNGCLNLSRLVDSWPWRFFKTLIGLGVLDKFFVGWTN